MKNAWLIGLYTNELEERIRCLGYKLTRFCSTLEGGYPQDDVPAMIVFSDDPFIDLQAMVRAKDSYPDAVLVSLPIRIVQEEKALDYPVDYERGSSITRLIFSIQERELRWDN